MRLPFGTRLTQQVSLLYSASFYMSTRILLVVKKIQKRCATSISEDVSSIGIVQIDVKVFLVKQAKIFIHVSNALNCKQFWLKSV